MNMHVPAIKASICLSNDIGDKVHRMLLCLRSVKQGPESGKLKASAAPIPRVEPWISMISSSSQPIPLILKNRNVKDQDNIMSRGELGNGRDLKPVLFDLFCPKCKRHQNCAKNKLFKTVAVSLSCRNCKTNTTSAQWRCTHGLKWLTCETHREAGMRCGSQKTQGTPRRPDPLKAAARLSQKTKKLGPLGSCPSSLPASSTSRQPATTLSKQPSYVNSTMSSGNNFNKRNKKNESYGELSPQYEVPVGTSRYWHAHLNGDAIQGDHRPGTSSNLGITGNHETGKTPRPHDEEVSVLAKRARLTPPSSSKHVTTCKGKCPTVWTIDMYCPHCHG